MLEKRALPFEVPSYSLTGDVLSFQRCGLQYRYYNGSSLPPSRPVQMWVGEFVHGVMEEAYRFWNENHPAFPWPCTQTPVPPPPQPLQRVAHDIGEFGHRVEARLAASGRRPRSRVARDTAYQRVEAAVNILGPILFPLITNAEERISGTRGMPAPHGAAAPTRGDRYELTGIVDVISSVVVANNANNPLVELITAGANPDRAQYDVIVDYKAGRRPHQRSRYWAHHQWQVQTYAWLREQLPGSPPVGAGMLIYVNELAPSQTDLQDFKQEMVDGTADVVPENGSQDYYAIHRWQYGQPVPQFSIPFLLRRAVRVVDVSDERLDDALEQIDRVIIDIEACAVNEYNNGSIVGIWEPRGEDADCDACDFRHFCPQPATQRQPNPPPRRPPVAPG